MPPVARTELPPTTGWLSTMTTLLPSLVAVRAAVMPAPPAPTMTMSVSTVESSAGSALFSTAVWKSSGFRPAAVMAAAAASLMALEVMVAVDTPSTAMLPLSAMAAGSCSIALEPTPSVSSAPSAVQPVILPSVRVRVTVTSPPKPLAVPVKSPVAPAPVVEAGLLPQP